MEILRVLLVIYGITVAYNLYVVLIYQKRFYKDAPEWMFELDMGKFFGRIFLTALIPFYGTCVMISFHYVARCKNEEYKKIFRQIEEELEDECK